MKFLILVCALISIAGFTLAGWMALFPESLHDRPLLQYPIKEIALDSPKVGTVRVEFPIKNPTGKPLRVIGYHATCSTTVCFGPADDGLLTIPAYGEALYACEVKIHQPG
ncbi:MAG: hypothetical protein ACRCZF_10835, partial [Gemmataceae bacterium]